MKKIVKGGILYLIGAFLYIIIEMIWRGYSHFSMFILGGICFICLGLINEIFEWSTPLWKQALIGATIITILEFITGCIVNLWFKWNVWDYSDLPFNVLGQVCLPFFAIWIFISILGIVMDDYLRYIIFHEEKPKYTLF
jgi:uncharacterized membrane protein